MFDIGWMELLIIGVVTLVAVGPKELPKVMHAVGRLAGKARRMMLALEHHIDSIEYESKSLDDEKAKKENHDS